MYDINDKTNNLLCGKNYYSLSKHHHCDGSTSLCKFFFVKTKHQAKIKSLDSC